MLMSASIRPNFASTDAIAASAAGAEVRSTPPTMSAPAPSRSAKPSGATRAWSMSATCAPRLAAVSATTHPSAPRAPVMATVLPCIMASRRRLHPVPERIELSGVKKSDRADHLRVLHAEVPGIGVAVGLIVFRCSGGVEEDDHHVAVGVEAAYGGHKRRRHASVERVDYLVEKSLAVGI